MSYPCSHHSLGWAGWNSQTLLTFLHSSEDAMFRLERAGSMHSQACKHTHAHTHRAKYPQTQCQRYHGKARIRELSSGISQKRKWVGRARPSSCLSLLATITLGVPHLLLPIWPGSCFYLQLSDTSRVRTLVTGHPKMKRPRPTWQGV